MARYSLKSGRDGDRYRIESSRKPGIGFPKLDKIAKYLASQKSELDFVPAWLKHQGRLYPLDRNSRSRFETAYTASGGSVNIRTREPSSFELEAQLCAIVGDPLSVPSSFSLRTLDRKEIERGSF